MKLFRKLFFYSTLMGLLAACGKDNKSGQSSYPYTYTNQYCTSTYGCTGSYYGSGSIGAISSPYAILNTAQAENPCVAGSYYAASRIPIQTQITLNSVVTSGDIFLGVTSYGDVAAIIGNGTPSATLVAYICPRISGSGQGSLSVPVLGAYTRCNVKPITALNMYFPDGTRASFRDPQYGSSAGAKFSFCY